MATTTTPRPQSNSPQPLKWRRLEKLGEYQRDQAQALDGSRYCIEKFFPEYVVSYKPSNGRWQSKIAVAATAAEARELVQAHYERQSRGRAMT
jgi:hypothetical protein